jgi:hypothetical protein
MATPQLAPPDPTRRVAYEVAEGQWFFRDPVLSGEWRFTDRERTALRWGAVMFNFYK